MMPTIGRWAAVEKALQAGGGPTEGAAAKFSLAARVEAAEKLITNRERVLNDICNSNRKTAPLPDVPVVPLQFASTVENGMIETARRLLGGRSQEPSSPRFSSTAADKDALVNMAKIIDARLQTTFAQCPGRAPDMKEEAGAALRAVVKEVGGLPFNSRVVPDRKPWDGCLSCFGFASPTYKGPPAFKVRATMDWQKLGRSLVEGGGEAEGVAAVHPLEARVEAAKKLITNRDAVLNDICNPARKSQMSTVSTVVSQNLAGAVEQGMKETARRLLGKPGYETPISSPKNPQEKQAWVDMAKIIEGRMQASFKDCNGRVPDMGAQAAQALIDVMKEVSGIMVTTTSDWKALEAMLAAGGGTAQGAAGKFSLKARVEAARALIPNRARVLNDVCNPARKTQPIPLKEVVPQEHKSAVENGMKETARRLLGSPSCINLQPPIKQPSAAENFKAEEHKAWVDMAKIIDARLQTNPAQCPGRKPDMGEEAGAALRAVLKEVCGAEFPSKVVPSKGLF